MKFMGYKRPDGTVGVRNYLLVLSSVVCANHVSQRSLPLFQELRSLCTATAAVSLVRTGSSPEDFRWNSEESKHSSCPCGKPGLRRVIS